MVVDAGASTIAGRLRRLADTIDEVVAGQLWIQICDHDPEDGSYVAKKILDRVYRESMEFGVGDLAKRRDEAWSATVVVDVFEESIPAEAIDDAEEVKEELNDLLQRAINSGRLSAADRDLLMDLARVAERIDAPGRRGRGGFDDPVGHADGRGGPRNGLAHDSPPCRFSHRGGRGGCPYRRAGDVTS